MCTHSNAQLLKFIHTDRWLYWPQNSELNVCHLSMWAGRVVDYQIVVDCTGTCPRWGPLGCQCTWHEHQILWKLANAWHNNYYAVTSVNIGCECFNIRFLELLPIFLRWEGGEGWLLYLPSPHWSSLVPALPPACWYPIRCRPKHLSPTGCALRSSAKSQIMSIYWKK